MNTADQSIWSTRELKINPSDALTATAAPTSASASIRRKSAYLHGPRRCAIEKPAGSYVRLSRPDPSLSRAFIRAARPLPIPLRLRGTEA